MKLSQRRLRRPTIGGMLATRQGSLSLALLCAACAAGILIFALGRYKSSLRSTTPQTTVLVASGAIARGTSGQTISSEGLYRVTPMVASQAAPGAITDAAQLAGKVAQTDIVAGQQLTAQDFSTVVGVPGVLAPGQRAIAIAIDEAHGATDVLAAGDHVDVYVSFSVTKGKTTQPTEMLLVPDALVIKPASSAPTKAGGAALSGASLVLGVSSAQAAQLAYAADYGKLYLVLRPWNASPSATAPVTQGSIVAGAAPGGS